MMDTSPSEKHKSYVKYMLTHPVELTRRVAYFLFGQTVGRIVYGGGDIFKSKWFSRPFSEGYKWMWRCFYQQKVKGSGGNKEAKWPVCRECHCVLPQNIQFHPDDLNNFQSFGIYFQAFAPIHIGRGTYIAPNVGLITQNHDITDPSRRSEAKPIIIGEQCWIGMNAVLLPGVVLGQHTVVGAGSVVTKSFPEGNVVIGGNPARVLKTISVADDNVADGDQ